MKKFAIVAGIALLAACGSNKDAASEAAASESAAASAAVTPAAVYSPEPGSYDVSRPDGKMYVRTVMADGAYVLRDTKGTVIDKGKWAERDGKRCFAPETGTEECYTLTMPAADGSFTATDSKGAVSQVKPHAK